MGKPLNEYLDDFYEASGKVSEICRNLSLAGIAVVWLFKNPEKDPTLFPKELILPLFFILSALALDFLQYVCSAVLTKQFHRKNEKLLQAKQLSKADANDLNYPLSREYAVWFFFIAKILCMVFGYILLLMYLKCKI